MGIKIVNRLNHLIKDEHQNKIRERKVLGFPKENGPLKAYSSIFYWSHMVSEYGCIIPERPLIGFEILTYVLKGSYESINKEADQWHILSEGDIEIIRAGKGIRVNEKLYPGSEILQIWLDPNLNQIKKAPASLFQYTADSFPVTPGNNIEIIEIKGKNAPVELFSQNISMNLTKFKSGKHTIRIPEDTVLSAYLIDGYMDINDSTISKFDFFKVDELSEFEITALSDCKLLMLTSPLKPEYQTYAEMML
jgi:redox-sensitive bicupin YhaK (pirin superfamily)